MATKKTDLLIKANMLEPLPDYETEDVAEFMEKIAEAMFKLFKEKDKDYDGSWQGRGLFSVQSNFERKVDRINAQFHKNVMTEGKGENIADTLIDASVYTLMYLYYMYNRDNRVKKQVDAMLQKYEVESI